MLHFFQFESYVYENIFSIFSNEALSKNEEEDLNELRGIHREWRRLKLKEAY